MAGTHQQLLDHIVFSTQNRKLYLSDGHRNEVFTYLYVEYALRYIYIWE
jgi:hypothetical protein